MCSKLSFFNFAINMNDILVMKFGGTSVKDASAMNKVLDIISKSTFSKNIIVLSACSGMTDLLINLTEESLFSLDKANKSLNNFFNHHENLINQLIHLQSNKDIAFNYLNQSYNIIQDLILGINILNECTEKSYNTIVAQGEIIASSIFYIASKEKNLNSTLLDSRQYIILNKIGSEFNISFNNIEQLEKLFTNFNYLIMQGFIASDIYGDTNLLGRGGSDYSAALIGSAVNSKEIQIWTDVDGVLTTDPKILENVKTISTMSFNEIRLLSFYGAKVLHPDTIKPAITKSIPVCVKNTFSPEKLGTLIINNSSVQKPRISSIHLNQNCYLLDIKNIEKQDYLKLLIILNNINATTFFSSINDNNAVCIIKNIINLEELETAISSFDYNLTNIDLLCICGTALSKPSAERNKMISDIIMITKEFKPYSLLFGITSDSFLISTEAGSGVQCLKHLHKYLFE